MNTHEQWVFVVDDDAALRDSLQWLLESADLQVATFADAQTFLDHYTPEHNGCLIMDLRMPGLSGLEAQIQLQKAGSHLPLIMISAYGDVDLAVTAMCQGALTFLEKPLDTQQLLVCVHTALAKDRQQHHQQLAQQSLVQRYASLTPREKEVLAGVVSGLTSNDIACELAISRKTVEGHRAHVADKMRAESLPELIRMAVALGLPGNRPDEH